MLANRLHTRALNDIFFGTHMEPLKCPFVLQSALLMHILKA